MEELRDQGRWQALVGGQAGTGFVAMAAITKTVVEASPPSSTVTQRRCAKMMTCDQGHEMQRHKIFTERTGLRIDSVDPHGPWQRG